jgi:hypothetical protein
MKSIIKLLSIVLIISCAQQTNTYADFLQGFETDTAGWNAYDVTTRTISGGGSLGLIASSGSYYAEVSNKQNAYGYSCGMGGFSYYGGKGLTYNGPFYQSIDVYIDTEWNAVPLGGNPAFWIDMCPYRLNTDNYGAEQNFRVWVPGDGQVQVSASGQTDKMTTITSSGWYTFEMVFRHGTNANDYVETDLNIYDAAHNLLGTETLSATSPGGPLYNSDLRGNGYVWLSVWQNGFANDILAIDNLRTGVIPEPATMSLLAIGALSLIRRKK